MQNPEMGKVLPNDEIVELIKDYRQNQNYDARNKVIMANMGAIYRMAHKYEGFLLGRHVSFEDLVSDGVLGIIEAVDKFDPSLNVKFSTYSHWWILKKITQNIALGPFELPFHRAQIYNKFKQESERCAELGIAVDIEKLCSEIGVSRDILLDTIQKQAPAKMGPMSLGGALVEKENLESDIIDGIMFKQIRHIIDTDLSERERRVIIDRFGLGETPPRTLEEISKDLDVSCEFVRMIQNKTLLKLKKKMMNRGSKAHQW